MRIIDYPFHQYYHQFMIIEADDLTEQLKAEIAVTQSDCYVLSSAYCDGEGSVRFNVLSLGSDWQNCYRGLRRKAMLGSYAMEEVAERQARPVAVPTAAMIRKNACFLKDAEKNVDEDVRWLRKDERLDALRVPGYADILIADFLLQDELVPAEICATGIEGPFLTGVLAEEFRGHPLFETLKCLPYMLQNEFRLLVVQAGNRLSRQDKERIEKIRAFYDSAGVDFGGMNIRS